MSSASAIIIAAGMGRRLLPLTHSAPKCMLSVGNRTLIQHQLAALRAAGIFKVSIIRGHLGQTISVDQPVTFFENPSYQHTNILESLFCAEPAIVDDVIIAYSDILYSSDIVRRLLSASADMAIAVDRGWRAQYVGRAMHPQDEAEKVILGPDGLVSMIGKQLDPEHPMLAGEFIGMLRLSGDGTSVFRSHYKRCKSRYAQGRFQQAPTLSKAYLTDFLQELIDRDEIISPCAFSGGWMEIDTVEDLNRARDRYGV